MRLSVLSGVVSLAFLGAATAMAPIEPANAESTPIKIGLPSFLSGTGAALGEDLVRGFDLYVKEVGGKFEQRPIVTVKEDTEGKPSVALAKVKKLIERDSVDLLFGILNSGEAYAVVDTVVAAKVPLVLNAGADELTQRKANPYVFRIGFTNSQLVHPLADYAYNKMGKRRAILIAADYPGGYEHSRPFERVFKQLGGTIVKEMWAPLGTTDFAPYLAQIRDADVVYAFFFGGDAIRLLKQYKEYGLQGKIPIIGNNLGDELILGPLGDAGVGVITSELYSPGIDTPANKAFVARFKNEYKTEPTQYAELGYTGARAVFAALKLVNGKISDREAFVKALRSLSFSDAPRGNVSFDQYGQAILTAYIRRVDKVGSVYQNTIIDVIPNVSQFWKWDPAEYIKTTRYVR